MCDTVLPKEWLYKVKSATRELIRLVGGYARAGDITGRGKSTAERWGSTDYPDIIPIASALLLESDLEKPLVTQAMADISGCLLTRRDSEKVKDAVLPAYMRATSEMADVTTSFTKSFEDGVLTPNEKRDAIREIIEAREALADFSGALTKSMIP